MYHAGLITQLWTAALMRNSYEWIALSSVDCRNDRVSTPLISVLTEGHSSMSALRPGSFVRRSWFCTIGRFAPPTLAASSSHSPTDPPLATEPFLLLVPRSGTVCHRRSHQRHHWTPLASVWRLICSPCHIRTYNYRNWLTSVSGPCSNFLFRPLFDW